MKTLFRWAFRLLILLVVLLVAGILLLNTVAREVVEYQLTQRTGLEVKLDAVRIGLLNPRVTVKGLVIYNRPEFGGSPLLDLPELHMEYDRGALWSRKIHLRLLRLNLAQVSVIEDTNGRLNLQALQKNVRQSAGVTVSTNRNSSADYQFTGIDTLNLTVGTANFQSLKNPAYNETLKPRLQNQVFFKINSPTEFDTLLELLLLRSDSNILMSQTGHANDRWKYWQDKLSKIGKE